MEPYGKISVGVFITEQNRTKYVHFVNSTKTGVKTLIFRIFCELQEKSSSAAQYLWRFQRGTVEMDEARLRALTHLMVWIFVFQSIHVEMDEARLGALTHDSYLLVK